MLPDKRRRQILDDEPEEARRFDARPSGGTSAPRNNRVQEDTWVTSFVGRLAAQRSSHALQFAVLPVLVFGLEEALSAVLGASVLRTLPQGSAGALASGIFFSESL
jgi:hypothetical protein